MILFSDRIFNDRFNTVHSTKHTTCEETLRWIEITRWLGSGPASEQTPMKIIESVGIQYYSYDTKYDRKL